MTVVISAGLSVAAAAGGVVLLTGARSVDTNTRVEASCTVHPWHVADVNDTEVWTPRVVIPC